MDDQTFDVADALAAMQLKAEEIGVKGVAAVLVLPRTVMPSTFAVNFCICKQLFRPLDPSGGDDDRGTNYLAVVTGKIAEMVRTGQNSGYQENPLKGEWGYRGGLMLDIGGNTVYAAFSGGSQDQDVEIALEGLKALGYRYGEDIQ